MRRTNIYLTDQQLNLLRKISEKTGLPVAEIVRRALDMFLKKKGE